MTGRERRLLRMLCMTASGGGGGGDKPWEEMTWDDVIDATKNGKYKDFEIGAMKELDLGSDGIVHMQIVGIDVDDLADGSGKAPLTFISKELLKTSHRMNPARTPSSAPYNEGTGAIGGWEKCEVRTYLKETIKPLIPENVRDAIQNVIKYSNIYNTSGLLDTDDITVDDIWLPSQREIFGGSSFETSGPEYYILISPSERIKNISGESEPSIYWIRTARSPTSFGSVLGTGYGTVKKAETDFAIPLGFCL